MSPITKQSDERIWNRMLEAFEVHRKSVDPDAHSALERIATNCLGSPQRISLTLTNCSVREEFLAFEALHTLKRFHARMRPLQFDGPIVILTKDARHTVIDGNNRVNWWLAHSTPGPFEAIIIESV